MFRFPDYSCEELATMFKNMLVERNFATDVTVAEIKQLIEECTTLEIRNQWNAGLCEKNFNLGKEHLDERLLSDSLSLAGENTDMSRFSKDDISNTIKAIH